MLETREATDHDRTDSSSEPVTLEILRRELTTFGFLYLLPPFAIIMLLVIGLRPLVWILALIWIGAAIWMKHKVLAISVAIGTVALWGAFYALTGRLL